MSTRITVKTVRTYVAELIEDGQLSADPIAWTGGDLGHGTRFCFVDSTVCLGPRSALEYVRDNVENLNDYMRSAAARDTYYRSNSGAGDY